MVAVRRFNIDLSAAGLTDQLFGLLQEQSPYAAAVKRLVHGNPIEVEAGSRQGDRSVAGVTNRPALRIGKQKTVVALGARLSRSSTSSTATSTSIGEKTPVEATNRRTASLSPGRTSDRSTIGGGVESVMGGSGAGIGVSDSADTEARTPSYHYSHKAATGGRANSAKPRPPASHKPHGVADWRQSREPAPIRQSRDRRSRQFGKASNGTLAGATTGRGFIRATHRSRLYPARPPVAALSSATTGRGFIQRDQRSRLYRLGKICG